MRLDSLIAAQTDLSRTAAGRLCEECRVRRNGRFANKSDRAESGDVVTFELPEPVELDAAPEEIPLEIVYEDAALLVVN